MPYWTFQAKRVGVLDITVTQATNPSELEIKGERIILEGMFAVLCINKH